MISEAEVHSLRSRLFPMFRYLCAFCLMLLAMATASQSIRFQNLYRSDMLPQYFLQPTTNHRSSLSHPCLVYHGKSYSAVKVSQACLGKGDFCS